MAALPNPQLDSYLPQASPELLDDRQLLHAAGEGDRGCLEEVYTRHWQAMRQHAVSIVGSTEAAEDVVQEAFAKTIRTISSGREITEVGGWLHTCVHNIALNVLKDRRRRAQVPLEDDDAAPNQLDTYERAQLREHSQQVLEALSSVPMRQRSAFVLSEVQGLNFREIAEELGTSVGSVRVLLFRARQQIRENLAK